VPAYLDTGSAYQQRIDPLVGAADAVRRVVRPAVVDEAGVAKQLP
jgi:hypothetical protein